MLGMISKNYGSNANDLSLKPGTIYAIAAINISINYERFLIKMDKIYVLFLSTSLTFDIFIFLFKLCLIVINIFSILDAVKILFNVRICTFISYGSNFFYYILKSIIFLIENFFVVYAYIFSLNDTLEFFISSVIYDICY